MGANATAMVVMMFLGLKGANLATRAPKRVSVLSLLEAVHKPGLTHCVSSHNGKTGVANDTD